MKIQPVVIAYFTKSWVGPCFRSYYRYFSDPLLVINNNPQPHQRYWGLQCEEEREWLQKQNIIYVDSPARSEFAHPPNELSHGLAMDFAASWCKEHGFDVMLHIEPDCMVVGTRWYDDLLSKIEHYQVVGKRKADWHIGNLTHTTIDLAGSMWKINEVMSFVPRASPIIGIDWDTAQEAKFNAKSYLFDELTGFIHYGAGSYRVETPYHLVGL